MMEMMLTKEAGMLITNVAAKNATKSTEGIIDTTAKVVRSITKGTRIIDEAAKTIVVVVEVEAENESIDENDDRFHIQHILHTLHHHQLHQDLDPDRKIVTKEADIIVKRRNHIIMTVIKQMVVGVKSTKEKKRITTTVAVIVEAEAEA